MTWNMKDRVEGFLEEFKGKVIRAGYMEGLISADKSFSKKMVTTRQLFLMYRVIVPAGQEQPADQPSWYGMGGGEFKFGGATEEFTLKDKAYKLYGEIIDGPALTKKSGMGMLLDRLEELKFTAEGGNAAQFLGLVADIKREAGAGSSEDSTLNMPVKLYGKETVEQTAMQKAAASVGAGKTDEEAEEQAEIFMGVVDGKTEKDFPEISKADRIKAMGIKSGKLFMLADKLVASGRLTKGADGVYHKA